MGKWIVIGGVEVVIIAASFAINPEWASNNFVMLLAFGVAIICVGVVWDQIPRGLRLLQSYNWLDMDASGRYYRDLLVQQGQNDGVKMFDGMSSPNPNQPMESPVAGAFRWVLQQGINEGQIEAWGTPENGSRQERLTHAEDSFEAYKKSPKGDALFLMMNGVYYRGIVVRRSSIRSYVMHIVRHDAQLKRRSKGQN